MSEGTGLGRLLLEQIKKYAKDSGHDCEVKGCQHLTLGFSCGICFKKVCNKHLYFQMATPPKPLIPVCPSCIVGNHPEMFEVELIGSSSEDDDDDDDDDDDFEEETGEVIDAEYEEI